MNNYRITVRDKGTIESKGTSPKDAFEKKFSNVVLEPIDDAFNANVCIELLNGKKQSKNFYIGQLNNAVGSFLTPKEKIIGKFDQRVVNDYIKGFEFEDKTCNPFQIDSCVDYPYFGVYFKVSSGISDEQIIAYGLDLFRPFGYNVKYRAKQLKYNKTDEMIYFFDIIDFPKQCYLDIRFDCEHLFGAKNRFMRKNRIPQGLLTYNYLDVSFGPNYFTKGPIKINVLPGEKVSLYGRYEMIFKYSNGREYSRTDDFLEIPSDIGYTYIIEKADRPESNYSKGTLIITVVES